MTDKTLKELVTETSTSDISDVIPSEEFSEVMINEAVKGAKLEPVISGVDERLQAGEGDKLRVPIFPTVSVSQKSEGTDYSGFSSYSTLSQDVTVKRYVAGVQLTDMSIYEANIDIVQKILDAIRRGYSNKIDEVMASEIGCGQASPVDFTPTKEVTLSSASDVYDDIRTLKLALNSNEWNPDTVVMEHALGQELVKKQEGSTGTYQVTVEDGEVSTVHGMDVITTSYATDYSTASTGDGAVSVLDSDIAAALARGKPATFEEERDSSKAATEQVMNAYFGFSEIQADLYGTGAEAFGIGLLVK